MWHTRFLASWLTAIVAANSVALGDGGLFVVGEAATLAQTRQEVVMAVEQNDAGTVERVTYLLRSDYTGQAGDFAWVIPLPASPEDVEASSDSWVFQDLDESTRPTFMGAADGYGIGCGCPAAGNDGALGGLVTIEAAGQAGILEWTALTSTGSEALIDWLNAHGYRIPAGADEILDRYIRQNMHFLALRVNDSAVTAADGQPVEIPAIQFACTTARRFYPMAISQISAASETEVLIYVIARRRVRAANIPNGLIDEQSLVLDSTSPSGTNYESLFSQTIADLGGTALITEYSSRFYGFFDTWEAFPASLADYAVLTRMRTVLARDLMDFDLDLEEAPTDETVYSYYWVSDSVAASSATITGPPLVLAILYALLRKARRTAFRT